MPFARSQLGWSEPVVVGDHRAMFILKGPVRTAIAHVFSDEQWETAHVRLSDEWLRSHDADREDYEQLKSGLVADGAWGSTYTRSKAAFIVRIVNMARAPRDLPPVQTLSGAVLILVVEHATACSRHSESSCY